MRKNPLPEKPTPGYRVYQLHNKSRLLLEAHEPPSHPLNWPSMAWRDQEGSAVDSTHFSQAKKEFQGRHGGSWLQSQLFQGWSRRMEVQGLLGLHSKLRLTLHWSPENNNQPPAQCSAGWAHSAAEPASRTAQHLFGLCISGLVTDDIFSSYYLLKKDSHICGYKFLLSGKNQVLQDY